MLQRVVNATGQSCRSIGQAIDRIGAGIEGSLSYTEHLNPSTRCVKYSGKSPEIASDVFVAANASIIGDVAIGEGSSVFYGAVIRGDVNYIRIGTNTNIQDAVVIHAAKIANDFPTVIGHSVTIGPNAIIHACTIEDGCIIGTNAQVLDGAIISSESMIAAGSIVPPNKTVPSGELWSGVPARYIRDLTSDERAFVATCALEASTLAQAHARESRKSFDTLEGEKEKLFFDKVYGKGEYEKKVGGVEEDVPRDTGIFFKY